jgi:hypothetical protein
MSFLCPGQSPLRRVLNGDRLTTARSDVNTLGELLFQEPEPPGYALSEDIHPRLPRAGLPQWNALSCAATTCAARNHQASTAHFRTLQPLRPALQRDADPSVSIEQRTSARCNIERQHQKTFLERFFLKRVISVLLGLRKPIDLQP